MTGRLLSRRRLLVFAGAVVGYAIVTVAWMLPRGLLAASENPEQRLGDDMADADILLEAMSDRRSAATIGAAALAALPDEADVEWILSRLIRELGKAREMLVAMPLEERRRMLEDRIDAEHLSGDTLSVNGWELASSEVLLSALAHLIGE